jgi:hypothetical protein
VLEVIQNLTVDSLFLLVIYIIAVLCGFFKDKPDSDSDSDSDGSSYTSEGAEDYEDFNRFN